MKTAATDLYLQPSTFNLPVMSTINIFIIALTVIVVLAVLLFINIKNKKDRKSMNPDSQDAVEETHGDKERKGESL